MLQLKGICLRFSHQQVFSQLQLTLNIGDRLGLVGANGAGKSTLLSVIAGKQPPDEGSRHFDSALTIGYLSQELPVMPMLSVMDHLKDQIGLRELETKLRALENAYTDPNADLDTVNREYQKCLDTQHELGAFDFEARCLKVLSGLGFQSGDELKLCTSFSGGWQIRIALTMVLLRNPQLLILDEPTNHLDTLAIDWLETYLKTVQAAVIVVSHDRAFLDSTVDQVAEIVCGRLHHFLGNYSNYEITKKLLVKQLQKEQESIEVQDAYRFVKRHTTPKGVILYADKLARLNTYLAKFDLLKQTKPAKLKLQFSYENKPSKHMLELKEVAHGYNDDLLFSEAEFDVMRDDRLAIIGTNGAGKSTLCRLMFGQEKPLFGSVTKHETVNFAFFSQQTAEQLNGDITLWQTLQDLNLGTPDTKLRQILAQFGFKGDTVFKFLGWLSGGEKCRFALACLLLEPANCLLLDEPTNHLDMHTKELLVEALKQYPGTMIVVSHDRWFLNELCNRIVHIDDGTVLKHQGNYDDFVALNDH